MNDTTINQLVHDHLQKKIREGLNSSAHGYAVEFRHKYSSISQAISIAMYALNSKQHTNHERYYYSCVMNALKKMQNKEGGAPFAVYCYWQWFISKI